MTIAKDPVATFVMMQWQINKIKRMRKQYHPFHVLLHMQQDMRFGEPITSREAALLTGLFVLNREVNLTYYKYVYAPKTYYTDTNGQVCILRKYWRTNHD